ncbi:hypothetical protein BT96DRAFT_365056 [Gymnopus androsaceus JB14]|uniref:BZIP domain-containing protein n=1 Tax=Gymnopus androsaceus JB14 TaxID=1447944 RepID=A0A6A4GX05_9AGAR|nr:hypothetical protein BT96DRAFT_365056 [Gymnopus androsaceus JB14]
MPSHLNGLNIVQPSSPSESTSQDLLSGPFPDLSLWTHLPFEADDGPNSVTTSDSGFAQMAEEDEEGRSRLGIEATAIHNGHVNVVTGTTVGNNYSLLTQPSSSMSGPSFDLSSVLSSFGINPLVIAQQLQPNPHAAPSVAQLLAMNAVNQSPHSTHTAGAQSVQPHTPEHHYSPPPAKRQRARKSSVPVQESSPDSSPDASESTSTPLTTTDDKRRRNTAASARFRLKKKERELALENKAKELEIKVNELEKECEGLRRENGWLKGLVVGVTGAVQNPTTGMKRPREEVSS